RSFFVILFDDVPGNARLYLRVHVSVQRCHPFAVDRRVPLHDCGDFYDRWRGTRRRFSAASASKKTGKTAKDGDAEHPAVYRCLEGHLQSPPINNFSQDWRGWEFCHAYVALATDAAAFFDDSA